MALISWGADGRNLLLLGIPILDIRHRRFLESGEKTLELQGGKKFKSLAGSLGIVIYVSQHSVLGKESKCPNT